MEREREREKRGDRWQYWNQKRTGIGLMNNRFAKDRLFVDWSCLISLQVLRKLSKCLKAETIKSKDRKIQDT